MTFLLASRTICKQLMGVGRVHGRRARLLTGLLTAGSVTVFIAGVGGALLIDTSDASSWLFRNGWLVWVGSLALITVIVAVALNLTVSRDGGIGVKVALGALLFSLLSAVFVIGIFVPYWGGWGGLELQQLEADADLTWRPLLKLYLVAVGVGGAFFGACVGFISWARRLFRRSHG